MDGDAPTSASRWVRNSQLIRTVLSVSTVLGLLAGCAEPPGRVTVEFEWAEPPVRDLWLWAHVRAEDEGIRRAAAGPALFQPGEPWTLALPTVPNGDDWIVVVEARARPETDARILYVGRSAPFAMRPGVDVTARVALALDAPRVAADQPPVELLFDGRPRSVVGAASIRQASVRFGAEGAAEAILAHDVTLSVAADRIDLDADPRVRCDAGPPRVCELAPWDLTAGVPDRGDGLHSVHLQLIDAAGYTSPTRQATVDLDTVPPELALPSPVLEADDGRTATNGPLSVRPDQTVRAAFTVTEALGGPPMVLVARQPATIDRLSADGRTIFADLPAGEPGVFDVTAEVEDRAGNRARLHLGQLVRDGASPDGLTEDGQPGIRLVVAPTGTEAHPPGLTAQVCPDDRWSWCPGTAPFGEGNRLEFVAARADPSGKATCGEVPIGPPVVPAGEHPLPCDCAAVCVAEIDPAGNRSPYRLVRHVIWMVGPGAGLPLGGPGTEMQVRAHRVFDRRPLDPPADVATDALTHRDRVSVEVTGAGQWFRHRHVSDLPRIEGAASAVDPTTGTLVRFGGWLVDAPGTVTDSTWTWDGHALTGPQAGGPEARAEAAMAYDIRRDEMLLFGGRTPANRFADTWRLAADGWTRLVEVDPAGPAARFGHAMAWDPAERRIILFGGDVGVRGGDGGLVADTWAWSGSRWRALHPGGAGAPSPRRDAALAFDEGLGAMVLVGGTGPGDTPLADIWAFDGAEWTRHDIDPPIARAGHGLAYARDESRLWMVGGRADDGAAGAVQSIDLAANGPSWTPVPGGADGPGGGEPAFDPVAQQVVVLGGSDVGTAWRWDGTTWTVEGPDPAHVGDDGRAPSRRIDFALDAVPTADRTFLFGGRTLDRGFVHDTWSWDGRRWHHQVLDCPEDACDRPAPRAGAALAGDAPGGPLLFGGRTARDLLDDTWRWIDGRWWPVYTPDGVYPTGRWGHRMVWDRVASRALVFGGWSPANERLWTAADWSEDTWVFSQGHWTRDPLDPTPSPRMGHGMVFDALGDQIVLWGGLNESAETLADLWTLDADGWRRRPTGRSDSAPQGRRDAAMVGGDGATLFLGPNTVDVWRWHGDVWRRHPSVGPGPELDRSDAAPFEAVFDEPLRRMEAAYDATRGEALVVVGSQGADGAATWTWSAGAGTRPAVVARYAFEHPTLTDADLLDVSARTTAYAQSSGDPNISLAVRHAGRWVEVLDAGPADDLGDPRRWSALGERWPDLLHGRDRAMSIAIMPRSTQGETPARLEVDQLSIGVSWRLTP